MKENKIISIIGHFGGNEDFLDGQTVKTKILYEELSLKSNWKIIKVDTYYKNKNPIKLLFQTIKAIINSKDIIILLSGNGMKIYFPLLSFCSKFFKKNIYHDVIGGNLDYYVKKYPKYKRYLNEFKCNWVETKGLKNKLQMQGITNCEVIPNFKKLEIVSYEEIKKSDINRNVYKFCTFSRVMKEKGISEAIDVINKLNNKEYKGLSYILDIYGPIDPSYAEELKEKLANSSENITYCGMIPFDRSVDILKEYDILLFPTYWSGEGFPGTIIDAFSAGVPVIASDWNCNKEIIDNNINGIIYPNEEISNLEEAISHCIDKERKFIESLKENCIEKAKLFLPNEYIELIIKRIEE